MVDHLEFVLIQYEQTCWPCLTALHDLVAPVSLLIDFILP